MKKQNSPDLTVYTIIWYLIGISLIFLTYQQRELIDYRWKSPGFAMIGVISLSIITGFGAIIHLFFFLQDLYHNILYKKYLALKATGVLAYVEAANMNEDIRRIFSLTNPKHIIRKLERIDFNAERDVLGVVCGEEVTGIAEGNHLTVTVTKPETRKAFLDLPKNIRKNVDIVFVPE